MLIGISLKAWAFLLVTSRIRISSDYNKKVAWFFSSYSLRNCILTKVYSGFWSVCKTSISCAVNGFTSSSGVYFIFSRSNQGGERPKLRAHYNSLSIYFLWFWQETHVRQAIHFCQWLRSEDFIATKPRIFIVDFTIVDEIRLDFSKKKYQ